MERAEASLTNAQPREGEALEKPRLPVHATRVPTPEAAHAALTALSQSWRDHPPAPSQVIDHTREAGKGRPTPTSPLKAMAWLVYSLTQRRLRQQRAERHETLPTQLHQPTERPTLRWVFPLLEGLHRVQVMVQGQVHDLIAGLNEVQINSLRLFGDDVCRLDQISPG